VNIAWRPCNDSNHVTAPYKLSFLLLIRGQTNQLTCSLVVLPRQMRTTWKHSRPMTGNEATPEITSTHMLHRHQLSKQKIYAVATAGKNRGV